jgi:hypothetical protein
MTKMPAPPTQQPASPWTAIQDFAKNVVTLAGLLIGLTVTFAAQLLGKAGFETRVALYLAWGFALLAIALGVASHGYVVSYLKEGNDQNKAVFCSNAAFVCLALAALFFVIFGWFAVGEKSPITAVSATEAAIDGAPSLSRDKNSTWHLKSLVYDPGTGSYDVVVTEDNTAKSLDIIVNDRGRIIKVQ